MQQILGLIYMGGAGTENDPHYASFQNVHADLSGYSVERVGVGTIVLTSPDFTENTSVFLPNQLASNTTIADVISDWDEVTGFILKWYSFEDGVGQIKWQGLDANWEPSDTIFNNYLVSIQFKQNPQQ